MPRTVALLCSISTLFALSACEPEKHVTALPIPPERTDCEAATGKRPKLNPEYVIDWSKVATVDEAHRQHDIFVSVLRGREQTIANYVLTIEGDLFQCASDDAWIREVQAETTR